MLHQKTETKETKETPVYRKPKNISSWWIRLAHKHGQGKFTTGLSPISIAFYDPWKQKPKNKLTELHDDTKDQHASLTIHKCYNWLQKTFEFQKQFQFQKNSAVKSSDFNQPSIHNAEQWLHLCTTIIQYSIQSFSWSLRFVMHQKLQIPGFIVLQI